MKKFLKSALKLLIPILCTFSTPGQSGKYTDAFEREVAYYNSHNLVCRVVNEGDRVSVGYYQYHVPVRVGPSYGPLQYEDRTVTRGVLHRSSDNYKCKDCGRRFDGLCSSSASVPTVSFRDDGNTRIMSIRKGCCFSGRPCGALGSRLSGELAEIYEMSLQNIGTDIHSNWARYSWEYELERLWKAARDLDNSAEASKNLQSARDECESRICTTDHKTYVVTNSSCCTIL